VGTFVNPPYPLIDSVLTNDLGLTETIQRAGLDAGTSFVDVRSVQATADQARRLGRQEGAALWRVERVRTANGRAVALTVDHVPADTCGPDFAAVVANGSIYDYFAQRGTHIKDSSARLIPAKAGVDVGRRLGISPESVVLLIEQDDYGYDGEVVLLSEEYHVRTAFRFLVRRERNEARSSRPNPGRPGTGNTTA
jgi:GntR family transcriptional regulator